MTLMLHQGVYGARLATSSQDVAAAQALRFQCFRGDGAGLDQDRFDQDADHMLIEDNRDGRLVACCRLTCWDGGARLGEGYAGQRYDLSDWQAETRPMAELGRLCLWSGVGDADVLRVIWGALTRYMRVRRVARVFGCSSFEGIDATRYGGAFALLSARHQGPASLRPGVLSGETVALASLAGDPREGAKQLPPLLRSYVSIGGWVGDHAVVDRDLNTLHVFTALDLVDVPRRRVRTLMAAAR